MIARVVDRIRTPSASHAAYRPVFGILMVAFLVLIAIDAVLWPRGHRPSLREGLGEVGALLLMIFFFSRQAQIRLFSYFVGMTLLILSIGMCLYGLLQYLR
jgi:hypothetical protein